LAERTLFEAKTPPSALRNPFFGENLSSFPAIGCSGRNGDKRV
jgi:hypothetical protein